MLFLCSLLPYYSEIPEIAEVVRAQIMRIKTEATKDDDGIFFTTCLFEFHLTVIFLNTGLHIITADDDFAKIVKVLPQVPKKTWHQVFITLPSISCLCNI